MLKKIRSRRALSTMKPLGLAALVGIVWLVFVVANFPEMPTRSECTIGFRLDWTGVATQQNLVRNEMFDLIKPGNAMPLGGASFAENGSRLYMIFKSDCGRKHELAADLMELWRSKGLDLPRFERIPDPIVHSPWTIDVQGPHWSDGWGGSDIDGRGRKERE